MLLDIRPFDTLFRLLSSLFLLCNPFLIERIIYWLQVTNAFSAFVSFFSFRSITLNRDPIKAEFKTNKSKNNLIYWISVQGDRFERKERKSSFGARKQSKSKNNLKINSKNAIFSDSFLKTTNRVRLHCRPNSDFRYFCYNSIRCTESTFAIHNHTQTASNILRHIAIVSALILIFGIHYWNRLFRQHSESCHLLPHSRHRPRLPPFESITSGPPVLPAPALTHASTAFPTRFVTWRCNSNRTVSFTSGTLHIPLSHPLPSPTSVSASSKQSSHFHPHFRANRLPKVTFRFFSSVAVCCCSALKFSQNAHQNRLKPTPPPLPCFSLSLSSLHRSPVWQSIWMSNSWVTFLFPTRSELIFVTFTLLSNRRIADRWRHFRSVPPAPFAGRIDEYAHTRRPSMVEKGHFRSLTLCTGMRGRILFVCRT
jgi:hypothetical protein